MDLVDDRERLKLFEQMVMPHLDAAYNLARWLAGNDHDAQDVAQEASLRAFKFFGNFRGENARAWLLTIVRNTCYTLLQRKTVHGTPAVFDEAVHGVTGQASGPAQMLERQENMQSARQAVEALPVELREVVVLRELEGLSYKEIAVAAAIPIGTVMSRLARGRERLQQILGEAGTAT